LSNTWLREPEVSAFAPNSFCANGRALVPIKDSMIDDEMERLVLTFPRRATARRRVLPTAYNAGKEAGERFEYRPGIEQG
jgi:hypothetical protein